MRDNCRVSAGSTIRNGFQGGMVDAVLEVIKRPTEAVLYSTIFVKVMDSSYPSQDGGERER